MKFALGASAILVAYSIFYSLVILPNKKLADEQRIRLNNEISLSTCITYAESRYNDSWKEYCKIDFRQIGDDGSCLLANDRADQLNELLKQNKDECYKKYK